MSKVLKYDPCTGRVLGIHPSASTPHYEGKKGFLINPDLSNVEGVSREYWYVNQDQQVVTRDNQTIESQDLLVNISATPDQSTESSLIALKKDGKPAFVDKTILGIRDKEPGIFNIAFGFALNTLCSFFPVAGGIPYLVQSIADRRRAKNLEELLQSLAKQVEASERGHPKCKSPRQIGSAEKIIKCAANAIESSELEAAKRAFQFLIFNEDTSENALIIQKALEIGWAEILILQDLDFWTSEIAKPLDEQYLPRHLAESTAMSETVAEGAISRLIALGLVNSSGTQVARSKIKSEQQISLSLLGQKVIELLEQPNVSND